MTVNEWAQLIGVVSIFLIFSLDACIAILTKLYIRCGRAALLWTAVYVLFLFFLRACAYLGIGTIEELRVLSGFSSLIPLLALLLHLYLARKIDDNNKEIIANNL